MFKNTFISLMFVIVIVSSVAITSMFSSYYISEQLSPIIDKLQKLEKSHIEIKEMVEIRLPILEHNIHVYGEYKIQSLHKKVGGLTGRMKVMEERMGLATDEYLKLLKNLEQSLPAVIEYKAISGSAPPEDPESGRFK